MSKPKPDFFEIKDKPMIEKIIDVSARHEIPLTVWLKNQSLKFDTKIRYFFRSADRISVELTPEITEQLFREAIAAQGSDEVFASFSIDSTNFFLKAQFTGTTPPDLFQVNTPKSIFKLQRRANLRIPFTRTTAPKLTVFDPSKTYDPNKAIRDTDLLALRVVDISAGGIGLAVPIEQKEQLKIGTPLYDMRFKLRGVEIHVNGIVRFASETVSDKGKPMVRLGVKFSGLKIHHEKHIVQFVLDESRRLFSLLHE